VWISEDKKIIAIRCPHKHFDKVAKVTDYTKPALSHRHYPTKERKIYAKDMHAEKNYPYRDTHAEQHIGYQVSISARQAPTL
jgi:hypothetical protein